jgi:hypothetical protein
VSLLGRHVARTLGTERAVADLLVARVRGHHGRRFPAYAGLFVLVTARPFATAIPRAQRARFVDRFVAPMLDIGPAGLAYVTGRSAPMTEPCEGLLEP